MRIKIKYSYNIIHITLAIGFYKRVVYINPLIHSFNNTEFVQKYKKFLPPLMPRCVHS